MKQEDEDKKANEDEAIGLRKEITDTHNEKKDRLRVGTGESESGKRKGERVLNKN